jgi:hypothetical protein
MIPTPIASGPTFARMVGVDQIRVRINGALAEIHRQLVHPNTPANDPRVQSIASWHRGFVKALRHPEPQTVINAFVPELVRLLRSPVAGDLEPPFSPELFGPKPMPIIRYLVKQMRDSRSPLYSEPFDQEAVRVLAAAPPQEEEESLDGVPEELLAQLRQIEAMIAQQAQIDARGLEVVPPLRERIHQDEVALQADIDRVARRHFEENQRIREETAQLRARDLAQRTAMLEAAEQQRQEANHFRAENVRLQTRLERSEKNSGELARANAQLKQEINTTRSEVADHKANWLSSAICVVASIALSWATGKPIIIIPPPEK